MINAHQLIKEYCYNNKLASPNVSGDNLYTSGDVLLYLLDDNAKIKMYYKMANVETKYSSKILRVSIIRLKVDVSMGQKLLTEGHELAIVHFEKTLKLNEYRLKDLLEYLNAVKNIFKEQLSSELLEKIPASRIVNKMKKDIVKKPIYWKELTYKLVYLF